MCGIAGWMVKGDAPVAPGLIHVMLHSLAHRGPDGNGQHVDDQVVLGHARLAIIDVAGGAQPLVRGTIALVGNGEIYNYIELRDEQGMTQTPTGSDFEPVVALIASQGGEAFARLRGMFTAAIRDDAGLWLARDPFGIKPLYITENEDVIAFASEPRALIAAGFASSDIRAERIADLMDLNYTVGTQTVWREIDRLPAGAIMRLEDGAIRFTRRLPALPAPVAAPATLEDAVSALDAVMEDSVRVHLRADVPYGLFLSGGVDSSLTAAMMARLSATPVSTFVCGFDAEGAKDERRRARAVAQTLKLDVHELTFTEDDFWRLLPQAAWAFDDPTTDPACLPTLKLAEAAAGQLKVVLSGEGGDELFAGYGRYRRALRPWWLGGRAAEPHGVFSGVKGVLRVEPHGVKAWRTEAKPSQVFKNRLLNAQAADVATWLHADLLLKLDRALMAHGLEGRTPFLDPQVAAFALGLPDRFKVKGRMGKLVLRHWLARHLPVAEPFAKKQGFTVPTHAWLSKRGAELAHRLKRNPYLTEIAHPAAAEALFAHLEPGQSQAAYNLLFYVLWRTMQTEGARPSVDARVWDFV